MIKYMTIMNNRYNKWGFAFLSLLMVTSCSEYDFIDDISHVGYQAPHVYWELPSSSAKAGDSVSFKAQYYTNGPDINSLEVWYNITENIKMEVSCPLVSTFTYKVTISESSISRQLMKISEYAHHTDLWNKELKAYVLDDKFPTSRTLRLVEWKLPEEFEQEKFDKLFPDTFITSFRTNLYSKMEVADLRKMMVATEKITSEEFRELTDYTIDQNSLDTIWSLKPEAIPVIEEKYAEITFPELIYNSTDQNYMLEYEKGYQLSARFRAVDALGVEGITEFLNVDLR